MNVTVVRIIVAYHVFMVVNRVCVPPTEAHQVEGTIDSKGPIATDVHIRLLREGVACAIEFLRAGGEVSAGCAPSSVAELHRAIMLLIFGTRVVD